MNETQMKAIKKVLGNVQHELHLAKVTKVRGPDAWLDPNMTIDEYIANCEKEIEELKEGWQS